MAIELDASTGRRESTSGSTLTFGHTRATFGDYVLVYAAAVGSFNGSGGTPLDINVTYGGVAMTKLVSVASNQWYGLFGCIHYLYGAALPVAAGVNVEIDFNTSYSGRVATAISYKGCNLQPPEASATSAGSGSTRSHNITTSSDNSVVFSGFSGSYTGSIVHSVAETRRYFSEASGPIQISSADQIVASAGSTTCSVTYNSSSYAVLVSAALAEAAASSAKKDDYLRFGVKFFS